MNHYLRILGYLRPYRGPMVLAVASIAMFAALDTSSLALLIPFLRTLFAPPGEAMAPDPVAEALPIEPNLLDRVIEGTLGRVVDLTAPPEEAMKGIILFLIGIFLLKNIFDYLRTYLVAWIEQSVTRDLRDDVYDHLVDLDLVFFGRTRMGQIVSRVTHDVEQVRTLVTKEVARIIQSFFEIIAIIGALAIISWKLTLVSLLALPGMFLIWGPLLRRVRRGDHSVLRLAGEVNSHLQETLAGIRLVKASAAEGHERKRFHRLTWDYFKAFIRTERFRALSAPITESVGALGTILVLWYGVRLVLVNMELGGEDFIGFIILSVRLYSPVKYLGKLPAILQPGIVAAERVFEFLDAPIEIRDRADSRPFPGVKKEIVFDNVSFSYRPGEPVLREVSFVAPVGTVTALVGPSGAGKTTVVDLLGRFYEATSGEIRVDGEDLRNYSIRTLRESLGIVSQDTVLFHDTIRSNIAYAMEGVAQEEIEAAARAAHAHEFIMALPDGYDTLVGERGTQLSGGQRQRIAIARALLRNPPILILDEATSALDSESERLVQSALERLLEGRTVFVIAHRLSTVQRADQILVLEKGAILQRGRHEELMLDPNGLYAHLSSLQTGPLPPAREAPAAG